MSLVNEMLNELQKEKSKGGNFDGLVAVNKENSQWVSAKSILVFLILIAVVLWLVYTKTSYNNLSITEATVTDKPTNTNSQSKTPNYQEAKLEIQQVKELAETVVNKTGNAKLASINSASSKSNLSDTFKNSNTESASSKLNQELERKELSVNNNASALTSVDTIKKTAVNNKKTESKKPTINSNPTEVIKTDSNPIATRTSGQSMIKVSRKSLVEKELREIASQWNTIPLDKSRIDLEQLLQRYSNLDSAWLGALNIVKQRDFDYHQQLLAQALNKFPKQPAFRMITVKQLVAQNNYTEALSQLNKIDSTHWQQTQYRIAGFLAQKVNDHIAAIRFYNHLLKNKPNQGDINMAIAISLEALNENSLAVAKFQRALEDSSLKPIQRQFITQRIAVLKG